MTDEDDNPLERILDELMLESSKGEAPPPESELAPGSKTPTAESSTGSTSRAYRFLADDTVIKDILQDMAKLSHEDLDELDSTRFGAGEFKSLDQVARETGFISLEQQEAVFRTYLEHRVDELKEKLVGARIGSYSIVDELGRGGMGIVFKARQESPMFTREVALKFMLASPETEAHDRERFVAEVKGLAGLSHPFLVPIFDSGIESDLYYFSMEFIDGEPLSEPVVTDELSVEKKVEIVRDIARALSYLHDQGVVHRDIKPGNIMLDRHGNAILLDFGIAQFSADPRRRVAQAGTPFYMAPEVIDPGGSFGPIGPGTDIYALGAVLYKLLTGQEVFPCENDVTEVFRKTLKAEPSFSTTRRRIVHPDLEHVMRRCLRKRVDERYASAADLADALDRFLKRTRFRLWHFVAAAVVLVLATYAIVVNLRDEPVARTPEALAAAAKLKAERDVESAKERIRELKQQLGLETLTLESDDEEWLDQRLEDLDGLALETGTSDGAIEFNTAVGAFQADGARRLQEKADAAMSPLRTSRYVDDGSWKKAKGYFEEAKEEGTSPTGLRRFLLAIDYIDELERQEIENRIIAKATRDAEKARQSAQDARLFLEHKENLGTISARALKLFKTADELDGTAKGWFADGEHKKARAAFGDAKKQYELAKEAYIEGLNLLADRRSELRGELQRFLSRFNEEYRLYLGNVPSKLRLQLEQVKQESRNRRTDINAAQGLDDLDSLRRRLERWRDVASRATTEFDKVKRNCVRSRQAVERILNHQDFLRWLPGECQQLVTTAERHLHGADEAIQNDRFLEAKRAYVSFARVYRVISKRRDDLVQDMRWIHAGRIDDRDVRGFWIDAREVTVLRYTEYLAAVADASRPLGWSDQKGFPERPVVGITYAMAREFAEHYGKSLPDHDQWRLALHNEHTPKEFRDSLSPDLESPDTRVGERWRNPAEWVLHSRGQEKAMLIFNEDFKSRGLVLSEIRALAGFRCVREAISWEVSR